jgi:tRNA(Ile2) C34 agmatinyltransferase TiaS
MARMTTTTPHCPTCNVTLELTGNRPLVKGYQVREYKCPACGTETHRATPWDHSLTEPHGHFYHE